MLAGPTATVTVLRWRGGADGASAYDVTTAAAPSARADHPRSLRRRKDSYFERVISTLSVWYWTYDAPATTAPTPAATKPPTRSHMRRAGSAGGGGSNASIGSGASVKTVARREGRGPSPAGWSSSAEVVAPGASSKAPRLSSIVTPNATPST